MTGFGRTGTMFAFEHADISPDFVCLGKAMSGGYLPMSAVMTTEEVYGQFYADYAKGRSFLHSNTFAGNALGAAVAVAHLEVFKQEQIVAKVVEAHGVTQQLFAAAPPKRMV